MDTLGSRPHRPTPEPTNNPFTFTQSESDIFHIIDTQLTESTPERRQALKNFFAGLLEQSRRLAEDRKASDESPTPALMSTTSTSESNRPSSRASPSVTLPGSYSENSFVMESQQRRLQTIAEERESVDQRDDEEVAQELGLDDLGEENPTTSSVAEKLYADYTRDSSRRMSFKAEVKQLINKTRWAPSDVIDFGLSTQPIARPRFALRPAVTCLVERVFGDLQALLAGLAAEIPQRKALNNYHYCLDPYGDLLPALRGSNSLEELYGAWDLLRERLDRGSRFVERYIEESRGLHPTSPASTAPEVYQIFEPNAPLAVRIREFKAHVPSHYQAVDEEDRGKLLDFDVPLQEFVEVPLQVQSAFPPREPEAAPQAFSYDEKGAREDVSFLSRTSLPLNSAATTSSRLRSGYVPPESISGAFRGRTRSKGNSRSCDFARSSGDPCGVGHPRVRRFAR